jgi:hypothetical protein
VALPLNVAQYILIEIVSFILIYCGELLALRYSWIHVRVVDPKCQTDFVIGAGLSLLGLLVGMLYERVFNAYVRVRLCISLRARACYVVYHTSISNL